MPRIRRQFAIRSLLIFTAVTACLMPVGISVWKSYAQPDVAWRRVAPFTKITFQGDKAMVVVEGKEYELVKIEAVPTAELLKVAAKEFGNRKAESRIAEDIAEVLEAAGKDRWAETVRLDLVDPKTGISLVKNVAMTEENRRAAHQASNQADAARRNAPMSKQALVNSVEEFVAALESRWSYLPLGKVELKQEAASLISRIKKEEVTEETIRYEFNKIIARGIDGHAGVSSAWKHYSGLRLPFLIEPLGIGDDQEFVAFLADRSQFVSPEYPFIREIDGRPMTEWIDAARECNPQGSTQYQVRHALRELRQFPYWNKLVAGAESDRIDLTLANSDGETTKVTLSLANQRPIYGTFPREHRTTTVATQLATQGIGYLRITSMDDNAVDDVHRTMSAVQQQGLSAMIVDVRGNGGGSREALRALFSYLTDEREAPHVFNAAVYRLHEDFDEDHLAARFMYRREDPIWDEAHREAIGEFVSRFEPEWQPSEDGYSDWHYMVLSRLRDREYFQFQGKVVVLMDAKCFSATDIFLAGLKGWPNVTLMGQASGGGSARSVSAEIADGRVKLRLGSMVSFQSNGQLFDGHGVQPDVEVLPTPEYFLETSQDNVLDHAVEFIGTNQAGANQPDEEDEGK